VRLTNGACLGTQVRGVNSRINADARENATAFGLDRSDGSLSGGKARRCKRDHHVYECLVNVITHVWLAILPPFGCCSGVLVACFSLPLSCFLWPSFLCPCIRLNTKPPRRLECSAQDILGGVREHDVSHPHTAPTAGNWQEHVRQFLAKHRLFINTLKIRTITPFALNTRAKGSSATNSNPRTLS
jgi:hypothetical protein